MAAKNKTKRKWYDVEGKKLVESSLIALVFCLIFYCIVVVWLGDHPEIFETVHTLYWPVVALFIAIGQIGGIVSQREAAASQESAARNAAQTNILIEGTKLLTDKNPPQRRVGIALLHKVCESAEDEEIRKLSALALAAAVECGDISATDTSMAT